MIAFTFQYSEQPMIESLQDALMEWISHIEIDQEKYSVDILPMVVDRVYQVFGSHIIMNRSDISESDMKVYIQNKEKDENTTN